MIRTILGFFGFVKIPLAVIQLNIANETIVEEMIERELNADMKQVLQRLLIGQKTLTGFLRSGRKVSFKEVV